MVAVDNGSVFIEERRPLARVKFIVLLLALRMLRNHKALVNFGTKWLLEVHHVEKALALRSNLLLSD